MSSSSSTSNFWSRWNRWRKPAYFNFFETFFPQPFLFVAFFGLANGYELLHSFDGMFKLTSTIYKRRTLRTTRRIPNKNVWQSYIRGNLSSKFLTVADLGEGSGAPLILDEKRRNDRREKSQHCKYINPPSLPWIHHCLSLMHIVYLW